MNEPRLAEWLLVGMGAALAIGGCTGSVDTVGGTGGSRTAVGGSSAETGGTSAAAGGLSMETGGTATAGGSSSIGSGGTCAGLEGDWNLVPTVTESLWRSTPPAQLDVGVSLRPIGVTLSQRENRCQIALRPQWEPEIIADLQWVDGALSYEPSAAQTWAACRTETWRLLKLQITPAMTPVLQMTSHMDRLTDDIMDAGTMEIGGILLHGPLATQIVSFGPSDFVPDWCWNDLTSNWTTTALPWETFEVATKQPRTDLIQHLVTAADDQNLDIIWRNPDDLGDVNRLALASTTRWETIMGKTIHVAIGAGVAQIADFDIPQLALSDGFIGGSLELLASTGTRSIETENAGAVLHLTGQSCGDGVLAAGRMHVTGKQKAVFSVKVNEPYGGVPIVEAAVIGSDNSATVAQLISADDAPTRIYSAPLNGRDEVGVQLTARGGCQALTWWPPDIQVLSITAE